MPKEAVDIRDDMLQPALEALNEVGYFNDENSQLGSTIVERHAAELEEALRRNGYDGPGLEGGGRHYSGYGAVYWLYNPDRIDAAQARALTDRWVRREAEES